MLRKKLFGFVLVISILISSVFSVDMLNTAAAAESTDGKMLHITSKVGSWVNPLRLYTLEVGKEYNFSVDYCVKSNNLATENENGKDLFVVAADSYEKYISDTRGICTFDYTPQKNQIYFGVKTNSKDGSSYQAYAWNFMVTDNVTGEVIKPTTEITDTETAEWVDYNEYEFLTGYSLQSKNTGSASWETAIFKATGLAVGTYNFEFDYYIDYNGALATVHNGAPTNIFFKTQGYQRASTKNGAQTYIINTGKGHHKGSYTISSAGDCYFELATKTNSTADVTLYLWNIKFTNSDNQEFSWSSSTTSTYFTAVTEFNAENTGYLNPMYKFDNTDNSTWNTVAGTFNNLTAGNYTLKFDYYVSKAITLDSNSETNNRTFKTKVGNNSSSNAGDEYITTTGRVTTYSRTFTTTGTTAYFEIGAKRKSTNNFIVYAWNIRLEDASGNEYKTFYSIGNSVTKQDYNEAAIITAVDCLPEVFGAKILIPQEVSGTQKLRIDVDFSKLKNSVDAGVKVKAYGVIAVPVNRTDIDLDYILSVATEKNIIKRTVSNGGLDKLGTVKVIINRDSTAYGKRSAVTAFVETENGIYYSNNNNGTAVTNGIASKSVMGVIKAVFNDTNGQIYLNKDAALSKCLQDEQLKATLGEENFNNYYINKIFCGYMGYYGYTPITTTSEEYSIAKLITAYMYYYASNGEGPKMLKLSSYYLDRETYTIQTDKEVKQQFGTDYNGVEIKPNTTYVFTFEYYSTKDMVEASAIRKTITAREGYLADSHLWETWSDAKQKYRRGILLEAGRGSFSYEFTTAADETNFALGFAQGTLGHSYIWNIKLTEKGHDENLFVNPGFTNSFNGWQIPTAVGQAKLLEPDEAMQDLPLGEYLPDSANAFYDENTWEIGVSDKTDAPVTENTAILYNKQNSSYDDAAETKRQEIVNASDTLLDEYNALNYFTSPKKSECEVYYISPNGNDSNDGTSESTAWKTTNNLADLYTKFEKDEITNGTIFKTTVKRLYILFERGGVYRGHFELKSNISYGAYGTGYKPTFYSGTQNYADEYLWHQTSAENIWAVNVGDASDIGNVIFDNGKKCGIKILDGYESLLQDFEFYHNKENQMLYLYYSGGNPGKVFNSIEVAYGHIMNGDLNVKNTVIENFCIKYAGLHGISFRAGSDNVFIRSCEIGYIGGSLSDSGYGRLGNGIEFVNSYSNDTVENCWIYQCYDTGYSFQNCSGNQDVGKELTEKNMELRDSLIEYCTMNIEIFTATVAKVQDITISGNILRFGGYGWGFYNRIGSNSLISSNLNMYKGTGTGKYSCTNFNFTNNVLDCSYYALMDVGWPNDVNGYGPTIHSNTYIQQNNSHSYTAWVKGTDDSVNGGKKLTLKTKEDLIAENIDTSPSNFTIIN